MQLQRYLKRDDHIASINDGASHVMPRSVEYVFFSDVLAVERVKDWQQHVKRFISREPLDQQFDGYPQWLRDKWTYYRDRSCMGDRKSISIRILEGGICHHHSTPAAIHWLCKYTHYDTIAIIGIDGGKKYAKGKSRLYKKFIPDLDEWKMISERVADICGRTYGKKIEFYSESNHTGESQQP